MGLPEIFINIVETRSDESGSLKKSKSDQKSFKTSDEIRMEDMKAHGDELPQYFATQLEKTYDEHLFSEATRDSMIKFVIKKIELTMTTLDSVPYLEAEIDELTFLAKVIGKLSKTYNLDIGSIKINRHQENPKFDQGVLARKSEAQNSSNQFFSSDYLTRSLTRTKDTSTSPILVLSSMYRLEGLTKMFHLNQTTLTVRGLTIDPNTNDYITWNVVNNLEMTVRPLKIALEMEIIQFINEYLFVREFNKIYNSLEKKEKAGRNNNRLFIDDNRNYFLSKEQNMKLVRQEMDLQKKEETKLAKIKNKNPVVPTFYNLVKVNPVHINVSYQTDNILTRLSGMDLRLETFEQRMVFLARQPLIKKLISRNIFKSITSIMKHKMLCGKNSQDDGELTKAKEIRKRHRALFGADL